MCVYSVFVMCFVAHKKHARKTRASPSLSGVARASNINNARGRLRRTCHTNNGILNGQTLNLLLLFVEGQTDTHTQQANSFGINEIWSASLLRHRPN